MSFLIPDALANTATGTAAGGGGMTSILFLVVFFGVFYFLVLRPQNKRQKTLRDMISNLSKGDEVVTSGGIVGKIVQIDENFLDLEIATGVQVKVQRVAISSCLPKGTLKA